jgi:hypothetical protein
MSGHRGVGDRNENRPFRRQGLPNRHWKSFTRGGGILSPKCAKFIHSRRTVSLEVNGPAVLGAQYRLARATVLLIGFTSVQRDNTFHLVRVPPSPGLSSTKNQTSSEGLDSVEPKVTDGVRSHLVIEVLHTHRLTRD